MQRRCDPTDDDNRCYLSAGGLFPSASISGCPQFSQAYRQDSRRTTLLKAVDALDGVPIKRDHPGIERGPDGLEYDSQPPIESVVGTVTNTSYRNGEGLVYEAGIYDAELQDKIENGIAEVMGLRTEPDSETGTDRVIGLSGIHDLDIVARGASESASIEPGTAAMSADALSAAFSGPRSAAHSADEQHRVEVLQKQILFWNTRAVST